MKSKTSLLLTLLTFITAGSSSSLFSATVLFSDDFNSYAVDSTPTYPNWGSVVSDDTGNAYLIFQQDTSDLFGEGTSNIYLKVSDTGNQATRMDALLTGTTTTFQAATLSLDFYEVGGVTGTSWNINVTDAFSVQLNGEKINGSSSSLYSVNTKCHLDIVLNNTTSTITYGDGDTLASQTYDVWIDGVLVLDDVAFTGSIAAGADLTKFNFTTYSSSYAQEIYADNVVLTSIPEPSTSCMLGAALIGLLGMSLRKRLTH